MTPILKSPAEIAIMTEAGRLAGEVLDEIIPEVKPGVSTLYLDKLAEDLIKKSGGEPGFKRVPGYYHSICTAVNEEVVHGIPGKKVLKEGDIVSIDLGVYFKGFHSDTAITLPIGAVTTAATKFMQAGREALLAGIEAAQIGSRVGDISSAVEEVLTSYKYGIVHSLTGHGVGRDLHEDPLIPNHGLSGTGELLTEGMVIAIEPIYTDGNPEIFLSKDGWTIISPGSALAGQFEHTVALTSEGTKVLTKRPSEEIPD